LEEAIGEKLLRREGRTLVLTDTGRIASRYAHDIFTMGQELRSALDTAATTRSLRLVVGVVDVVPRLVAFRLLEPALRTTPYVVTCQSDSSERLAVKLARHEVDVVISPEPLDGAGFGRLYSVLLGESETTIFATSDLAKICRKDFPRSLDARPFLLPADGTPLRRSLERWFRAQHIRPDVRGEFDDSALLKTFGRAGIGLFAGPSVIAREIAREYRVRPIGRAPDVIEQFFVVSASRKTQHPAVTSIWKVVRDRMFSLDGVQPRAPRARSRRSLPPRRGG
jgi:LysR family transcriptional activator of nhaA